MGFGLTNRGQLRDFNERFSTNMLRSVLELATLLRERKFFAQQVGKQWLPGAYQG